MLLSNRLLVYIKCELALRLPVDINNMHSTFVLTVNILEWYVGYAMTKIIRNMHEQITSIAISLLLADNI